MLWCVFLIALTKESNGLVTPLSRIRLEKSSSLKNVISCPPFAKRNCASLYTRLNQRRSSSLTNDDKEIIFGMTRKESRKVIPLAIIFFMVLFNYTILRDTKDVLVITAPKSGAEIIPFLKTYVNLPGAIIFTIGFTALSNRYSQPQLFRGIVSSFLGFFALFATILYPARNFLHPNALCDTLATMLPASFAAPIAIFRNWTFSLFYMCAELWGSVVASLLFWSLANSVMNVQEAKKYYPFFGLFANIALVFSGQFIKQVAQFRTYSAAADPWASSLKILIGGVTIAGGILLAGHEWLQRKVLNDPQAVDPERVQQSRQKNTMSVPESITTLAKSSYIRDLATLVISYGLAINIVEVTWKSKLKQQFPDPSSYAAFMGNFSSATGLITFFSMLLGRFILKRTKWTFAASIPPLTLLSTGIIFFSLNLLPTAWAPLAGLLGMTPLALAVLAGAAQNIASKATKYSLFDPCKEIAYISMDDPEQRTKGKAAVDVIGGPFGKSFGSILQQMLILSLGSLAASTPYLGLILFLVILNWVRAVRDLGPQVAKKQQLQPNLLPKPNDVTEGSNNSSYDNNAKNQKSPL
uniref:ADP,ATP carrier protein n=1 Tax=Aureoumbra lagunensis TaxID=44058 RepID=A0A7S3K212_9STRA|mmetsp:Transcript_1647/g.2515  ORF Transcript_1647/g.2515 Transcript_1647/m.2515 type:complete len:582 (-) Transcript_1647:255-2000(-)